MDTVIDKVSMLVMTITKDIVMKQQKQKKSVAKNIIIELKSEAPVRQKTELENIITALSQEWKNPKEKNIKNIPGCEVKLARDYKKIKKYQDQINQIKRDNKDAAKV